MKEHVAEIHTLTADLSTAQVACTIHPDGRPVVTIIQIPGWFREPAPLNELIDMLDVASRWLAEHGASGGSVVITPDGETRTLDDIEGDGA